MYDAKDVGGEHVSTGLMPIPDNPQAVLKAAPDRATFVLIALDRARQWLVSASSIEEVNELRARAEAVRVYTRQAELGKEAENAAAEIRLRAERRVGELLQEMELAPGRPRKWSSMTTISSLGVNRDQAAVFQRMAARSVWITSTTPGFRGAQVSQGAATAPWLRYPLSAPGWHAPGGSHSRS